MVQSDEEKQPLDEQELEEKDPFLGTVIADKYEILGLLGGGGAGLVYRAKHKFTKKIVAVKLLFPQMALKQDVVKRFQQEAQAAGVLSHPHIVTIYDFGISSQGPPYMVMDYIPGVPLSDILEKEGTLSVQRAIAIFLQVCDALTHAHERGVVHRDLKPSNLMTVTNSDGTDAIKVVDFGLAKPLPTDEDYQKLTQTGQVFGSPFYMSPEQCRGLKADLRSDVYSMGCLMYECLLGAPPFVGDDPFDTIYKQLSESPKNLDQIKADPLVRERLEVIILKALAKDPALRYQSMKELAADLTEASQAANKGWRGRAVTLFEIGKLKFVIHRSADTKAKQAVMAISIACVIGGAAAAVAYVLFGSSPKVAEPPISWQTPVKATQIVTQDDKNGLMTAQFFIKMQTDLGHGDTETVAQQLDKEAHFLEKMRRSTDAESEYRRAFEIRQHINSPQSLLATSAISLANCYYDQRKFDLAKPLYEQAISIYERLWGGDFLDLAKPARNLADIYNQENLLSKAEHMYQQALFAWQKNGLDDTSDYTLAASGLGEVYLKEHKLDEAEKLFSLALERWQKIQGPEHQNAAFCLIDLAKIAEERKDYDRAASLYQEAIPIMEATAGHEDLRTGKLLERYADTLWKKNSWFEALSVKGKANKILAKYTKAAVSMSRT